jgi:hypothetical protein
LDYAIDLCDQSPQKMRWAWFLVMVQGFSRQKVARIVFDQKIEIWLNIHL